MCRGDGKHGQIDLEMASRDSSARLASLEVVLSKKVLGYNLFCGCMWSELVALIVVWLRSRGLCSLLTDG